MYLSKLLKKLRLGASARSQNQKIVSRENQLQNT